MSNSYTANDIHVLKGLDAVRKRPGMYIGSTNSTGLHHLVWEIVTNSVDEALSGYGNLIITTIHKDGSISVSDEGRGVPFGINKDTGKDALEVIYTELHAGGKFDDSAYKSSGGLHGVGAAVTNALSIMLEVTSYRDGKIAHISFKNGGEIDQPVEIIGTSKKHGTVVKFKPDPAIFSTVEFKYDVIHTHLQELAFLMKGVHFTLIDERSGQSDSLHYENGLSEYVQTLNKDKKELCSVINFSGTDSDTGIGVEIALQYCYEDYNETLYSYANNVRTKDGGTHETGFRIGLTKAINDFVDKNDISKAKKLEGNDIREGLTAIVSLIVPEKIIEYEGQTKGKLGTPQAQNVVSNFMMNKFGYYLVEHKDIAMAIIQKCIDSQNARLAARKAKDEARSTKKAKQDMILSDKLTPAQSKEYAKNELFIVEGDSAGGTARKGRDRIHQAILPLRGKPLNTDSVAIDKLLQNEEFSTLIYTIGAGFGQSFDIKDIKYGKIIIMTDADTDGAHIQTLLLTFFYHYMRELITSGHVYVAVPPLYRAYKEVNHKMIQEYAWDDNGLIEAKKKVGPGCKVNRYKGLGEMNEVQLKETTMDPKHRLLVQVSIEDPLFVEKTVDILMGKDTGIRRKWVEENVDFNEVDSFIDEVKHG